MAYKGMISDIDLERTLLELDLRGINSSENELPVLQYWSDGYANGSIRRRVNDFWKNFETALEVELSQAEHDQRLAVAEVARQEAEVARKADEYIRQKQAELDVVGKVVINSVTEDMKRQKPALRTQLYADPSFLIEEQEGTVTLYVSGTAYFGNIGRKNATRRDVNVLKKYSVDPGTISFDSIPGLDIERLGGKVTPRPLESTVELAGKPLRATHSLELADYIAVVPRDRLPDIYAEHGPPKS